MGILKKIRAIHILLMNNLATRQAGHWRVRYYRARLKALGEGAVIAPGAFISGGSSIEIGDHFSCSLNCFVAAGDGGRIKMGDNVGLNCNVHINAAFDGRIEIGNKVMIGPNVVMRASDHCSDRWDIPMQDQGHLGGIIYIEDDVWIGANAVLTRDIKIGHGSIIGAGAVVTKDIPPYSLAVGVPAKVIRNRNSNPST